MFAPSQSFAKPLVTILHDFTAGSDGRNPYFGLVKLGSKFYGATTYGGIDQHGVYYSITPDGKFTVIHTVAAEGEAQPYALMLSSQGALYGYAFGGPKSSTGDFYRMEPDGTRTVIYAFTRDDDLAPVGAPVELGGIFYGASKGGLQGISTIFSITLAGTLKILHMLDVKTDGYYPETGLTAVNETLYGVATEGGAYSSGTAFSITPSGTFSTLHSFGSSGDGSAPEGTLLTVNGTLYGTTHHGLAGYGNVYSLTTSGFETSLYAFTTHFRFVSGNLLFKHGAIYGDGNLCIFKAPLADTGKLSCFYQAGKNKATGNRLNPGLLRVGDSVYGTTGAGGKYKSGTIFKITD